MKIIVTSLLCATLANQVEGGAYQDGYKEGERRAQHLWSKEYDEDCYSIFDYSIEVKDDLIYGDYKPSRRQNWREEAFNRGGRHGASNEVVINQKDCLDPNYCDELGKTAAELLVADFCGTRNAFAARERSPVEMCRVSSTRTCEGNIYDKIKHTIKQTGSCDEIDDDIDNLTTALLLDLQDECEEQIDDMIEWHEFDDTKSESSSSSDSDSKDNEEDDDNMDDDNDDDHNKRNKKKKGKKNGRHNNKERKLREVSAEKDATSN